jgi:hypothetical protein
MNTTEIHSSVQVSELMIYCLLIFVIFILPEDIDLSDVSLLPIKSNVPTILFAMVSQVVKLKFPDLQ